MKTKAEREMENDKERRTMRVREGRKRAEERRERKENRRGKEESREEGKRRLQEDGSTK